MDYNDLCIRNRGIFTENQQKRIKNCTILIIGTGGIGGFAANCFARSGVGNFILSDFDSYEPTNMNRQINCTVQTIGMNKAVVTARSLEEINPDIRCEVYDRKMSFSEIEEALERSDLVFPAADDFPFSLTVFRMARRLMVPALVVVPSGMWSRIAVVRSKGPYVEELFGLPRFEQSNNEELYAELSKTMKRSMYKKAGSFYKTIGGWRKKHFNSFLKGEVSPAQICPLVWSATSLGVYESIKFLTGKGKAAALPSFLEISSKSVKKRNLRVFSGTVWRIKLSKIMIRNYMRKSDQS